MSVVVAMGKFTAIQTEYAIKESLPKGATNVTAHIIVGTPGTMTDLIRRKVIDVSEVKVFVLDEADNMLDKDVDRLRVLVVFLEDEERLLVQPVLDRDLGDLCNVVVLELIDVADDLALVRADRSEHEQVLQVAVVAEGRRL